MNYTKIIMGDEKFHFSGEKLVGITKETPKKEGMCAQPGCYDSVRSYKSYHKRFCSQQHANQYRAEKNKIKTGLRDPQEILDVLNQHEGSIVKSAQYLKVEKYILSERMIEFNITIKKTAIMGKK